MVSPPIISLAKLLTGALPAGLDKAMFLSTGGEANECAMKLAKVVSGKFEIVGLSHSWHGMTSGAVGAQYIAGRTGSGPLIPGMHILAAPDAYRSVFRHSDGTHDWKTELDYGWSLIDRSSCGSLAAVILEPILSSGGMITLPPGYLRAMKTHCEKRGMLLIVDEAQTALGRCGDVFAINHASNDGVVPDIITLSKTLGNGLRLSAVVTSERVAQTAQERGFLFYTTHANDPLPAAVGLAVTSIVLRDDAALVKHARVMGKRLHAGLEALKSRYACIGEIKGRGLLAGVEIVRDRRAGKEVAIDLGRAISDKMLELGLSAIISASSVFSGCIRVSPPIVITTEQLDAGLEIIGRAFGQVEGTIRVQD